MTGAVTRRLQVKPASAAFQRQAQGFTLIEVLIGMGILLVLVLLASRYFVEVTRQDAAARDRIPAEQAARGSLELITQEIRSAIGTRVNFNGSGLVRPELPAAGERQITLFTAQAQDTLAVTPPLNYPSVTTWAARTQTGVLPGSDCTPLVSGAYLAVYSTAGTSATNSAQRLADASRVVVLTASGCPGGLVSHSLTPAQTYNPNTYLVRVTPVTYFLDGRTLRRQVAGQAPQTVAEGLTELRFAYQPDRTDAAVPGCDATQFYAAPACAPGSIEVTLTSAPLRGSRPITLRQIVFLR